MPEKKTKKKKKKKIGKKMRSFNKKDIFSLRIIKDLECIKIAACYFSVFFKYLVLSRQIPDCYESFMKYANPAATNSTDCKHDFKWLNYVLNSGWVVLKNFDIPVTIRFFDFNTGS